MTTVNVQSNFTKRINFLNQIRTEFTFNYGDEKTIPFIFIPNDVSAPPHFAYYDGNGNFSHIEEVQE